MNRERNGDSPLKDPWFKATLPHSALGANLKMHVPHDVFSTQRIDEGTLLLLDHLPDGQPSAVLDMGCGYGALGLPIAARYPHALVTLVDRDLLAVKWSSENARANGVGNVLAYGSLGYRDLHANPESFEPYDWILCNVPARIGRPFIENLLEGGRIRLKPNGELRVVVINDLAPVLQELEAQHRWSLTEAARGPRHSVYRLPAKNDLSLAARPDQQVGSASEPPDLYLRDEVELQDLRLDRPFDLGGDDPKRLSAGLPALLDTLPRQFKGSVFCFRSGYGQLPLTSRKRWPEARVIAVDRDLLATTFTLRNARKLGLNGESLEIRESASFPEGIRPGERFDLILGELSPSAGGKTAESELLAISKALVRGGEALILSLEKLEKEWVKPFAARTRLSIQPVLRREGYVVLSMRGAG